MFSMRMAGLATVMTLGVAAYAAGATDGSISHCKIVACGTCDSPCESPSPEPCGSCCKPKPCKECSPVCCHPKADIDVLHGVNKPCTTDLRIGYKVNTSHTCDDFDLLVRVEHCGNLLFERLIHLGRPYRTSCDGTRHFHGSVCGKLPEIICANRCELRITGWVIPESAHGDTCAAIDHEHKRVHACEDSILGDRVPLGWPAAKTHDLGKPDEKAVEN